MKELVKEIKAEINKSENKDDIKLIINTLLKPGVIADMIDIIFVGFVKSNSLSAKEYVENLIEKVKIKTIVYTSLQDGSVKELISQLLEDDNNVETK